MRIALVTESFLPQMNGVTNSVLRVGEHLQNRGHQLVVVAPGDGPSEWAGVPVVRTPAVGLPGYKDVKLARPSRRLTGILKDFRPDLVHLASPAVLGAQAAAAAKKLSIPTVAIYQTDLAGFAARYGLHSAERMVWRWLRHVHDMASRTLAPSRCALEDLQRNGVPRVARWARGVDLVRFAPQRRDDTWRQRLAPNGEVVIGYVGRLAKEKQLDLLTGIHQMPGTKLVVVGDGPMRQTLERQLPGAHFTGFLGGSDLGAAYASLDVFVHTGAHETFCQGVQEALASGVPVVAPSAGGPLDLINHGTNGLYFQPGSTRSLHRQVSELVGDTALRKAMAQAAHASVQGRSWEVIGDELVGHYREVLAR